MCKCKISEKIGFYILKLIGERNVLHMKKKTLFILNIMLVILMMVVACVLPSKLAEKDLDDVFD